MVIESIQAVAAIEIELRKELIMGKSAADFLLLQWKGRSLHIGPLGECFMPTILFVKGHGHGGQGLRGIQNDPIHFW